MELDTLITWVLLFLFFVLPSLLKRKKKKAAAPAGKKTTAIGKLGDTLRAFIRDLERQALEAKKKAEDRGRQDGSSRISPQAAEDRSVWDLLDDRVQAEGESGLPEEPILEEVVPATLSEPGRKRPGRSAGQGRSREGKEVIRPKKPVAAPSVRAAVPRHSLLQAVVWSEILGPPKALRRE